MRCMRARISESRRLPLSRWDIPSETSRGPAIRASLKTCIIVVSARHSRSDKRFAYLDESAALQRARLASRRRRPCTLLGSSQGTRGAEDRDADRNEGACLGAGE